MAIAQMKPRLTPAEYLAIERAAETRSEYFEGEIELPSAGARLALSEIYDGALGESRRE